jgi:hypothetical protein
LLLLTGFVPALGASFATIAASVLVTVFARRRLDKGRALGATPLTLAMMAFALLVQLGLHYLLFTPITSLYQML